MYCDSGFGDWVYEIDEVTGKDISNGVMKIDADYKAALQLGKSIILPSFSRPNSRKLALLSSSLRTRTFPYSLVGIEFTFIWAPSKLALFFQIAILIHASPFTLHSSRFRNWLCFFKCTLSNSLV
jgi:hypothetical protein